MDKSLQHPVKPWYRQFWPWFIMALPAAAVVGGITTVIVASIDRDGLVKDDYYKEGLAINRDLARVDLAKRLGVEAQVSYDRRLQRFMVQLNDARVGTLQHLNLELVHPTRPLDVRLTLAPTGLPKTFAADDQDAPVATNWHVRITPPDESWKLEGRIQLPTESPLLLK